ncbi:CdaR family protein [Porphyromonas circumdentaria]|uniref:YbbR-like protein n=1 Tax=Porphyromonas circumdentaria TaxID=29524 RepID=A0A1T4LD26_9PORP|nr:hypothetical protein [Porphyromonas circumdentaria]MBB6275309.1 hypothetical protein [Porphyromonas circumdentaria]MDO4722012.1 hypothetical protein [Porphyromonas circumdentaria]SJZ52556.1 hypothetical protein SAMN02745171_00368 [Porphyromonas circumdentaria]
MKLQLFTQKTTTKRKKENVPFSLKPQSKKGKKFVTFLFFLLVSSIWWAITSLQMTYTKSLKMPLNYTSLKEYSIQGVLPEFLEVEIEGTGFDLLFNYTFRAIQPIEIKAFSLSGTSKNHFYISYATLEQWVQKQLEQGTKIQAIYPREISVELAKLHTKEVPIKSELQILHQDGFLITKVDLKPSKIKLYGSKMCIDTINLVHTEAVEVRQLEGKNHISTVVSLKEIPNVRFSRNEIDASITFEELTEKNFDLDINVKNLPVGYRLRLLPSKANLRITLPKSLYTSISEKDFKLLVDYSQIHNGSRETKEQLLPIGVEESPVGVTKYSLTPARVQYILEKE